MARRARRARDEWLREKLSGDANTRLLEMLSPATLGLPAYFDRDQAERARRQGLEIGQRLAGYDRSMDRLVATFEAIETASTVAGIVLGAGVVATAVKSGGKLKSCVAKNWSALGYVALWLDRSGLARKFGREEEAVALRAAVARSMRRICSRACVRRNCSKAARWTICKVRSRPGRMRGHFLSQVSATAPLGEWPSRVCLRSRSSSCHSSRISLGSRM